jgi:hypothetical protein
VVTCCGYCGSDLSYRPSGAVLGHWDSRCPDCGLASDEGAGTLLPGDDEVEYSLAEWAPPARIELRTAVAEAGVPWRWEPGPLLIVREEDQEVVEAILDDFEADAATAAASGDGEGEDYDEEYDEAVVEADEAAHQAMSDLFLLSDRLLHEPSSRDLVAQIDELGTTVAEAAPPFGVEPVAWERIADLASAVVEGGAVEDDDEAVAAAARALRDYLRPYV